MFQKQQIMRKVLYSLAPIFAWAIFLWGWRVAVITGVVFLFGILTEFVVEKGRNKKVSEAVLVTNALFALSLPPAVPLWVAIVGIVFAVFMGKAVFGGFGRNVYNPAITGRLFTYIAFPLVMQTTWMLPGMFGTVGINGQSHQLLNIVEAIGVVAISVALYVYITKNGDKTKTHGPAFAIGALALVAFYVISSYAGIFQVEVDLVSGPTPLEVMNGIAPAGAIPESHSYLSENNLLHMFLGFRMGSIGESSIFLILIAAVYLMATKTANWRMIVFTFFSALILAAVLYYTGAMATAMSEVMSPVGKDFGAQLADILRFVMAGSLMYVATFMATDPVSGPNKPLAQIIYAIIIGSVTVLIRVFSGFPEGTSFAIMVGNTFASLLDEWAPAPKKKKKKDVAKAAPKTAEAGGKA